MTEAVLDASVVLKWFVPSPERHRAAARRLRAEYEAGRLRVLVPDLLALEVLNVAGRRWRWPQKELVELASAYAALGFDVGAAPLSAVAAWVGEGLTAYDAAYVALASEFGVPLVTDDERVLGVAGDVARSLGSF